MKTFTQRNLPEETGTLNRLMFIVLLMGSLLAKIYKAEFGIEWFI